MKDRNQVTIRPSRPEDEPLMVKFHETLSDRSVYLRYFCSLSLSRRVAHERLLRICFGDYDREMVLVAERIDPGTGERRIIAVGRMTNFMPEMRRKSLCWFQTSIRNLVWGMNCFVV
jgi:acetyltransferase